MNSTKPLLNHVIVISGGSRGRKGRLPSSGPKLLHFHAVFRTNWSDSRLPPPGNPIFVTSFAFYFSGCRLHYKLHCRRTSIDFATQNLTSFLSCGSRSQPCKGSCAGVCYWSTSCFFQVLCLGWKLEHSRSTRVRICNNFPLKLILQTVLTCAQICFKFVSLTSLKLHKITWNCPFKLLLCYWQYNWQFHSFDLSKRNSLLSQ